MGLSDRTFCRICEAACGLVAVRGNDSELIGLRPDREHPTSRGYACAKGTRFVEVANHPSRLRVPRLMGREVAWTDAIDHCADRLGRILREHGPHAIGLYFGNPLAFNSLGIAATLAFAHAIGTRNLFYAGSQDCNNKFTGAEIVHGSEVIHPIPDFGRTDFALIFGSNPYISQSSFVHLEGGSAGVFNGIERRGGSIVWVDPRRSESARKWGEHLPIVPGTDAWLMLGLLKLLASGAQRRGRVEGLGELLAAAGNISLDEVSRRTGIEAKQIESLAARIAKSPSVAMHMSVGVNQSGFGTLAYVLLHALAYVTGNLDKVGGSLFSPLADHISRVYRMAGLDQKFRSRVGGFTSTLRTLPGGVLADEILTPGEERIRALIVVSGDPLRSIPGSSKLRTALSELDFLMSVDLFENATGELAHALLPAASWLERWDVAIASIPFQRTRLMQTGGPVAPPFANARTDAKIISDIARAMRLPGARWWLGKAALDRFLPRPRFGIPGRSIRPGHFLQTHRLRFWNEVVAADLERLRGDETDPDAFRLIGRRRRLGHNSWLHGGVRDGDAEPTAWLHPDDMDALGLADGDPIELRSSAGTLRIAAARTEGVARRTVVVPHGLPDVNINEIIPGGAENIERASGQLVMTGVRVSFGA